MSRVGPFRRRREMKQFSQAARDLRSKVIEALKQGKRPEVDDVPLEIFEEAFGKITDFDSVHKFSLKFNDLLKKSTNDRLTARLHESNKKENEKSFALVGVIIEINSYKGSKRLAYAPANKLRKFFWAH